MNEVQCRIKEIEAVIDCNDLEYLNEVILKYYPNTLPIPYIFPTFDNNILFEWNTQSMPSIDFNLSEKSAYFHAFDDLGDVEQDFSLTSENEIHDLFNFISKYVKGEN